ncbi:C_GCAxxG_C_C family protein [Desulfosarcina variabilis str. Montpellier]|uniref:C-GCAxxG-C-C family protein n=1 Tax=Desulfosarcina variabilis TaxID=2300 RepID=UPI003AFAD66F
MNNQQKNQDSQTEALISGIADRARNLYLTRQMLCTEAVLAALNQGLGGGLTDTQATAMAAPFCIALGDSGCLCGALSGAVMGTGLLLGKDGAYRKRKGMRDSARQLHDQFKLAHGATCCRVLSKKVKHDSKAHFDQCAGLTARAAEMAARLVLEKRPELAGQANNAFINRRQSVLGGMLSRLAHLFSR